MDSIWCWNVNARIMPLKIKRHSHSIAASLCLWHLRLDSTFKSHRISGKSTRRHFNSLKSTTTPSTGLIRLRWKSNQENRTWKRNWSLNWETESNGDRTITPVTIAVLWLFSGKPTERIHGNKKEARRKNPIRNQAEMTKAFEWFPPKMQLNSDAEIGMIYGENIHETQLELV